MSKRVLMMLPVMGFIALAMLFFYRLAFTDLILARGDTYAYFYPYWTARDLALSNGDLPLWTPNLFMGVPLLANSQLGTFYPPNWLTVSLDAPQSIKISILLHTAWASLGAFMLARRRLGLAVLPAVIAGAMYGFGGHIGAHVEQINQLQGLAWMPWLFYLFDGALKRPIRYVPWVAVAWAMQLFSGHTQTVFITGVGLGLYGLGMIWLDNDALTQRRRHLRKTALMVGILLVIALLAVLIALPQLVPSQELTSLSNRGGGLNQQEATAFSWTPELIGRGLLPSYESQVFGEYIAYTGIIGLALAMVGAGSAQFGRKRSVWVFIALIGVLFALGRFNPLYLPLTSLPGFNLFRVPARWLALFALGASMLAGMGLQTLMKAQVKRMAWSRIAPIMGVIIGLVGLSFLATGASDEVVGSATPTTITLILWLVAGVLVFDQLWGFSARFIGRRGLILSVLVLGELWLASQALPYNDVTDSAVYNDPRFAINQMQVYGDAHTPAGRLLSISDLLFDPGDRAQLEARWDRMDLGERAAQYAFTATKMQETLAGNLPLVWGIPSIDGFDGGLLPTIHYTAFTSLMLPDGALRTIDGRLREIMALEHCRGACIPDDVWLDLTNTQYLLTDKRFDLNHDSIFYDTQFTIPIEAGEAYTITDTQDFVADSLNLLVVPNETLCADDCLEVSFGYADGSVIALTPIANTEPLMLDGLHLQQWTTADFDAPDTIIISADEAVTIRALSLVDRRTGDFVQLTPNDWRRIYSAEVKIYENLDVTPRAFLVHDVNVFPDDWDGTEQTLVQMQATDFDPTRTVILNTDDDSVIRDLVNDGDHSQDSVTVTDYNDTEVVIDVTTDSDGYLVLTDAYYTGWQVESESVGISDSIYRADGMFRAVYVPAGEHTITMTYAPNWLRYGGVMWLAGMLVLVIGYGGVLWVMRRREVSLAVIK